MTSLPCPLPGPDASKAGFPDIAPVPSVVAAYQLGLSPVTAAAPDLPYSGPYGHLLPYPYSGPAIPGDSYLPCQLSTAPSQPALQERETGPSCDPTEVPRGAEREGRSWPHLPRRHRSAIPEPPRGPALSEPRSLCVPIGNPSVSAAGRRRGQPCTNRLLGPLKAYSSSQPALGEGRDVSFPGGSASGEGGPYNTGGDGKAWGTFHTLMLGGLRILAFKAHSCLAPPTTRLPAAGRLPRRH
ncbi:homeobox protein DLX-4 isoform X2 [Ovis aries]|uniref:homeobox protein DLX-4 isoform X2 n=1 Tax=Ovis aries TaxID=9940 RepID=UPI0005FB864C|nr:homeobox protein DLX-4 isoform X2 [Ovis aries]XP_060250833.1 homeobox protein DLX-4 isoform X2 [Ovis aries]